MGSPERRAMLATSATCLALSILDYELRMWGDLRRVLLLILGLVISAVAGALFNRNRDAVILLGSIVGLFITAVELSVSKHVWPSWAIAAGLAWPLSLALVVRSARVVAAPGSALHALSSSVPWLVPGALSAWTACAGVVLCVWHRPDTGLSGTIAHFEQHPWTVGLLGLGCLLACAQVARSAAGFRLRAGKRDLGLGVEEKKEDAKMSAYRAGPIAVSAAPKGVRALVVYGSVAAVAIALSALAIAPAVAIEPMCVCEVRTSYAERDRSPRELIGRGIECAEQSCWMYSPAERITATERLPVGELGTFAIAGEQGQAHEPLIVLEDADAWAGSPEDLPAVVVYADGLVLRTVLDGDRKVKVIAGTFADPTGLAASIARDLVRLPPRLTLSGATDQPETTIYVQTKGAWRGVTAVGFRGKRSVDFPVNATPPAFTAAWSALAELRGADEKPFTREDFVVQLNATNRNTGAGAWPAGLPPPPADLLPDDRYAGHPRAYEVHGKAALAMDATLVRDPISGEPVFLHVRGTLPAGAYLEKLRYCKSWDRAPFRRCDIRLPGRQ